MTSNVNLYLKLCGYYNQPFITNIKKDMYENVYTHVKGEFKFVFGWNIAFF